MSDLNDPRVLFAAERTLLAWNRTSIALIAFGFLVERSGMLMDVISPERTHSLSMVLTFWTGMLFILAGVMVAIYSSRQYSKALKTLKPVEFPAGYGVRWGMVVNGLVAFLGLILAIALVIGR